jgi:hypothetical protein
MGPVRPSPRSAYGSYMQAMSSHFRIVFGLFYYERKCLQDKLLIEQMYLINVFSLELLIEMFNVNDLKFLLWVNNWG